MKRAVMCIVESSAEAENAVEKLRTAGFPPNEISVLFPNKRGTKDFAYTHATKAPEGAIAGVGAGSVLGGGLGLLIGMGALSIPGFGPLIAAGPLLAALSGAAAGAAALGIAGALVGMGVPEIEAKRYEGKIRSGGILVSVHTESSKERGIAEDIFRRIHAHDICSAAEASVPRSTHSVM